MPYKAGPGGQRSPAGTAHPGGGSSGGGIGAGGGFGIGGIRADGPGPRSSAGSGVSPSKGERVIGSKSLKGSGRRTLSVFEKASQGLPMDDDELAQLTPEQRAAWEAQRAAVLYGAV